MLHPVIMAGGSGTRFWPRSRRRRPKQLIRVFGEGSMVQQTVSRLRSTFQPESFLVLTNAAQARRSAAAVAAVRREQVIAGAGRARYGACIGVAALILL